MSVTNSSSPTLSLAHVGAELRQPGGRLDQRGAVGDGQQHGHRAAASISSISVPSPFAQTNTCGSSLAAGSRARCR
jgi:hypothetical protein